MGKQEIGGVSSRDELIEKYGTSGMITVKGIEFPIIDIPMMSDEKWQKLAEENAVHNFKKYNKREPVSVVEAINWQRQRVAERERGVVA